MTTEMMSLLLLVSPFAGVGIGLLATILFDLWTGRYDEAPEPLRREDVFARKDFPQASRPSIDRRR